MISLGGRQANYCEYRSNAAVYLVFEVLALQVFNNTEVGMAYPGVDQLFIKFYSFLYCLVSCHIVVTTVKLFCAVSSRHHVDDCFIALVSELDGVPGSVVKKGLPDVVLCICHSVHNTSIAEKDSLRVGGKCGLQKDIF